ncbi:CLIP-associating protein 1-A [Ameca splendens]|uniref:CLIP-associating protein 1-A n=1 Tax=Ameca splendens TaxID=208324 RepID=A0ABV1A4X8_9TELE
MRVLNTGTEVEAAVADALLLGDSRNKRKPLRRRYESPGMYSDDDANSDASSACSERSYSSRNGGIPHYLRQTEDVAEVLNHCASSNWSERKEGLLGLQNLLKSQRILRLLLSGQLYESQSRKTTELATLQAITCTSKPRRNNEVQAFLCIVGGVRIQQQ